MSVTVKRIQLWRADVPNRPGVLAAALRPLAESGASLQVVMSYRYPGDESRSAIEVFPITSKKAIAAARAGGLSPAGMPTLLVEGDDRAGLGHAIAEAMAGAGINMGFLVTHVVGRKYGCVIGFGSDQEAKAAAAAIRKVAARTKR